MNKAQKFLLDNKCYDVILNAKNAAIPEDWIYVSDIMVMFLDSEKINTSQLLIEFSSYVNKHELVDEEHITDSSIKEFIKNKSK